MDIHTRRTHANLLQCAILIVQIMLPTHSPTVTCNTWSSITPLFIIEHETRTIVGSLAGLRA